MVFPRIGTPRAVAVGGAQGDIHQQGYPSQLEPDPCRAGATDGGILRDGIDRQYQRLRAHVSRPTVQSICLFTEMTD